MIQIFSPYPLFLDLNGNPLSSGSIYIGEVGQNPETHQIEVFWDEAGTIPASQPFKTTNGAIVRNGRPSKIFTEEIDYSITVKDSGDRLVYTAPRSTPDIYGQASFLFGLLLNVAGSNTITADSGRQLSGYQVGQRFRFEVATTNTDVVTLNIDGAGAVSVIWPNESALTAGELVAGDEVDVQYKYADSLAANCFVIIQTTREYMRADSGNISATAAGTANAITATMSPPIVALKNKMVFHIRATAANSGATTLKIDSTAIKSVYKGNNIDLVGGEIPGAGYCGIYRYDATIDKYELLNPYNQSYSANVTVDTADVTLTSVQYGASVIYLSGTLTGNRNLIFPNIGKAWSVINMCTGSYYVTCKTTAGTGVVIYPGNIAEVSCDTINIYGGSPISMIRLNTANGYGSTATKIRRFTNVVQNIGTDITYADSAANGASFTINTAGVYAITYGDSFSASNAIGLSLNSVNLTTSIDLIPIAEVLVSSSMQTGYNFPSCWTGYLAAGGVVRPHTNGAANGITPNQQQFTIVRTK